MKKQLIISNTHGWTLELLQEYETAIKNIAVLKRVKTIRYMMEGYIAMHIAQKLGLHRETVTSYVKKFNHGGMSELLNWKTPPGKAPFLSLKEQEELKNILNYSTPSEQGCTCNNYWDTRSLQCVIKSKFCITMSRNGIGEMLRRWGFKYQYPSYKLSYPSEFNNLIKIPQKSI